MPSGTPTGPALAALTARWLRDQPLNEDTVVCGAGLWPLLALLAGAAEGPARAELGAAVGLAPEDGPPAARALLALLDAEPDLAAALGTWLRDDLPLADWWVSATPPGTVQRLTGRPEQDQPLLDAWARERTAGLIEHFPLRVTPEDRLVLATAIALRTRWASPFQVLPDADGERTWLGRTSADLDTLARVGAEAGRPAITVATVVGTGSIDVRLGIGPDGLAPGEVLDRLLAGRVEGSGAALLDDPPPGAVVRDGTGVGPTVRLELAAFEVRNRHDLLERAELLGLGAASTTRARFPGLSAEPLFVGAAVQEVLARFEAEGFEAAAVTATGMRSAALASRPARQLLVRLDRPFGFSAVDRASGLVLFAGWIADPG